LAAMAHRKVIVFVLYINERGKYKKINIKIQHVHIN